MRLSFVASSLRQSRVFSALDDATLAILEKASQRIDFQGDDDAIVYQAGDPTAGVYLIPFEGNAGVGPSIHIAFPNARTNQSRFGWHAAPGEIFGDTELLTSGLASPIQVRITAATPLRRVSLILISLAPFLAALQSNQSFQRQFIRNASRHMTDLLTTRSIMANVHPDTKLAEGLLSLVDEFGAVIANRGLLYDPPKQNAIAQRLGMSLRSLSLRLSNWSARGLINTIPFGIPDIDRLERIASFGQKPVVRAIQETIEEVSCLIKKSAYLRANQIATDVLVIVPGNPILIFQVALACARMGATDRAIKTLDAASLDWDGSIASIKERIRSGWEKSLSRFAPTEFEAAELHSKESVAYLEARLASDAIDISALHARLIKDCAFSSGRLSKELAIRSAEAYEQIHTARPNHFCAVNAATMRYLAGDAEGSIRFCSDALSLAKREANSYWSYASMAESLLLLDRASEARSAVGDALAAHDCDAAKMASTRLQLHRLSRFSSVDAGQLLTLIDPGSVVFFSGPLMFSPDGPTDKIRLAENIVRDGISKWISKREISFGITSAGCGADILFAEAMAGAGIPYEIVLPFNIEQFKQVSVGVGEVWEQRFLACLDKAESVTELWRQEAPSALLDYYFKQGNLQIAGRAILRAEGLLVRPEMLAIIDQRKVAGPGSARQLVDACRTINVSVSTLASPFERNDAGSHSKEFDPFAPVVFAFSADQADNGVVETELSASGFVIRTMRDHRASGYKAVKSFAEARIVCDQFIRSMSRRGVPARTICDFGPIRTKSGLVDGDATLKLDAAFDLPIVSDNTAYATEVFAMADLASGASPTLYIPINTTIPMPNGGFSGGKAILQIADC